MNVLRLLAAIVILFCGISSGGQVKVFDHWGPEFKIAFDFKLLQALESNKPYNVLQLTNGGGCCKPGDRLPCVAFVEGKGHMIHFATTLSELSQQMSYDYPVEIGRKYSIVIEQKLIAVGKARYAVQVDGEEVWALDTPGVSYTGVQIDQSRQTSQQTSPVQATGHHSTVRRDY